MMASRHERGKSARTRASPSQESEIAQGGRLARSSNYPWRPSINDIRKMIGIFDPGPSPDIGFSCKLTGFGLQNGQFLNPSPVLTSFMDGPLLLCVSDALAFFAGPPPPPPIPTCNVRPGTQHRSFMVRIKVH